MQRKIKATIDRSGPVLWGRTSTRLIGQQRMVGRRRKHSTHFLVQEIHRRMKRAARVHDFAPITPGPCMTCEIIRARAGVCICPSCVAHDDPRKFQRYRNPTWWCNRLQKQIYVEQCFQSDWSTTQQSLHLNQSSTEQGPDSSICRQCGPSMCDADTN